MGEDAFIQNASWVAIFIFHIHWVLMLCYHLFKLLKISEINYKKAQKNWLQNVRNLTFACLIAVYNMLGLLFPRSSPLNYLYTIPD